MVQNCLHLKENQENKKVERNENSAEVANIAKAKEPMNRMALCNLALTSTTFSPLPFY